MYGKGERLSHCHHCHLLSAIDAMRGPLLSMAGEKEPSGEGQGSAEKGRATGQGLKGAGLGRAGHNRPGQGIKEGQEMENPIQ